MSHSLTRLYTVQTTTSTTTSVEWESIEAIAGHFTQGYIILWQHHAIFTGVIENGTVSWLNEGKPVNGDNHLVRLRAFDSLHEYHFWRSGQQIKGRLRNDAEGSPSDVVETKMKLRSVIGKPLRKAPFELDSDELAVVTRNYIGYDEVTHQAGYVDSRFVTFESFKSSKP